MFIPEEIERGAKSVSYKEFVKEENAQLQKRKLFGRKKAEGKSSCAAA